ncbi:MAG: GNAT family N-acetyltransferase [Haloplanus sp.]
MTDGKTYPDEPAGPFPEPPIRIEDREERSITVRRYDESRDRDALEAMYDAFDPADRAQGIPPTGEERIADWLDSITGEDTVNVVASHGDAIVGHATLVHDGETTAELAIFVLQEYQGAGIGTHLLETLLGAGREEGIERVWLSVERWNEPAIALYEKVGFVPGNTESFEHEMTIRLT